jgi:NADPH-dependent glutamate synthase beta subunit-like oxidoreductase
MHMMLPYRTVSPAQREGWRTQGPQQRGGNDADVIVAGAGPAVAAFATRLAAAGYNVLLIDRARFPRDKVCGDFAGPVTLVDPASR